MPIKMKKLMEESGESKSTILFYVKEGLLPEPQKPKPNLHLYDESCINIVKFIKYLQHQFSYSIAQIKTIFSENKFDFSDDFSMMLKSLEMMSIENNGEWYSREEFLKLVDLDSNELENYIERGWIFEQKKGFGKGEANLVKTIKRAKELNLDSKLFDEYVKYAQLLAKQEYILGAKMIETDKEKRNEQYRVLFDVILNLKPYIFNMHTIKEHKREMELKL